MQLLNNTLRMNLQIGVHGKASEVKYVSPVSLNTLTGDNLQR